MLLEVVTSKQDVITQTNFGDELVALSIPLALELGEGELARIGPPAD